ncbi:MAG: hypothetical protein JWR80_3342 [Bradyrhizobium sp.]|nr:hypothetical protein [Bradyrhizobium sp.]
MTDCRFDFNMDPAVVDMDLVTFRDFVNDTCVPVFYETLAKVKSKTSVVEEVLTDAMRDGEGHFSFSADSHGEVRCEGGITFRF